MISVALLETSIFILLVKKVWGGYRSAERWMDDIYKNSQAHILAERLWHRIKVYFSESFFGRVTEINEDRNFQVFDESKFVRWLLGLYKKQKENFIQYLTNSESVNLIEETKRASCISSVKTVSIVVIIAIITNIILLILLNKDINLFGWFVRLTLLFVGLGGIFCDAGWDEVKKTSFILSSLRNI